MNNDRFEENVATLFASHADTICRELCEGTRGARATHPQLIKDVKNAAFCVARSRTFRELAVAVSSSPTSDVLDVRQEIPAGLICVECEQQGWHAGNCSQRPAQ